MSAGGVFTIITNDGKADKMLTATALLLQRIADIACAKRALGLDPTPQLAELEKTHVLYVNAHFKPYVAIGFEYQKVRSSAGVADWGTSVQFSIPQFGDFFHDMVLHLRIGAVSAAVQTSPSIGSASFPVDGLATDPSTTLGPNMTDAAVSVSYNTVDASGTAIKAGTTAALILATPALATGVAYRNLIRYVEYPALRIVKNVKFEVNGNPLDQYDSETAALLHKFTVAPNKEFGTNVLLGQENPLTGYSNLRVGSAVDNDTAAASVYKTPTGIYNTDAAQSNQTVDLFTIPGAATTGISSVSAIPQTLNDGTTALAPATVPVNLAAGDATRNKDVSRYIRSIVNGPQTPKPVQAPLEVWYKTRFWFNDDVRLSVPSVAIPYGQRFITFDLNTPDLVIAEYPSIFIEKTVATRTLIANGPVTATVDPAGVAPPLTTYAEDFFSTTLTRSFAPYFVRGGFTSPSIITSELFVNNIFVNPEVHDIFIKRIGFSLIRVFRTHRQTLTTNKNQILLSQLKWPIEYMFVGFRPQWNNSTLNLNMWHDWHRMTRQIDTSIDNPSLAAVVPNEYAFALGAITDTTAASATNPISFAATSFVADARYKKGGTLNSTINNVQPDLYFLPVPTIDTASLSAHGVTLYDSFPDVFFSAYEATHYGGANVTAPTDPGALFITFSLFPGSYQPSGHINISRAREFYLSWTSSYISTATPCDAIVVAKAINFLLISDGSAMLRYTT